MHARAAARYYAPSRAIAACSAPTARSGALRNSEAVSAPVVDDEAIGTVVAGLVRALHGDAVEKRAEAPLHHPAVRGMPGRVDSGHELRAAAFGRQRLAGREEPVEQGWRIATGAHGAELDVGHAAAGFAPLAEVTGGKSSIGKDKRLAKRLV